MNINLYNTLDKQVSKFVPIHEDRVGLYACGFTVYDYTHLGHLRKYTMDDVLVRALRYQNSKLNIFPEYKVKFVQNVTDVGHLASDADTGEDKLEKGAKKYGKSVWDVAQEFEEYFFRSMDLMGNLRPDVSCRATDHIKQQLEMVKSLEQKGFTYVIEDDGVYFDTSKFPDYGKMAGLNLHEQEEGARIGVVAGKRNTSDFALWKFERPGENRAMIWPSPWHERSFPGWHIECSAMAMEYLGDQLDIHTGGIDHIPVHHTNEIAQAEAVTNKKPFVRYWVHHNFLKVEGEKMSKSLGNFFTIDDVLQRGFHPLALRLLFLTAHYRSEMNFTWDNLEGMQKAYEKLIRLFVSLDQPNHNAFENKKGKDNSQEILWEYQRQFYEALGNDLNTSQAISILWSILKDETVVSIDKKVVLLEFDKVLGIGLKIADKILDQLNHNNLHEQEYPHEIQELLNQRLEAKNKKDYQKSDQIRDQLLEKGYKIEEYPDGSLVIKITR